MPVTSDTNYILSNINIDLDKIADNTETSTSKAGDESEIKRLLVSINRELKSKIDPNIDIDSDVVFNLIKAKAQALNNKTDFLQAVLSEINPLYTVRLNPGSTKLFRTPSVGFLQLLGLTQQEHNITKGLVARLKKYQQLLVQVRTIQQNNQFDLENIDPTLLKAFNYIEKHCSDYLNVIKNAGGKILYRGVMNPKASIFIGYPRSDRKPRDSDPKAQELLDKYLRVMGFEALRHNSLFAISYRDEALRFGELYAIFPKNGFKYTWSTENSDIVLRNVYNVEGKYKSIIQTKQNYWFWIDKLNDYGYRTYDGLATYILRNSKQFNIDDLTDNEMLSQARRISSKIKALPEYQKFANALKHYNVIDDSISNNSISGPDNLFVVTTSELHRAFIDVVTAFLEFTNKTKFNLLSDQALRNLSDSLEDAKTALANIGNKSPLEEKASEIIANFGFKKTDLLTAIERGHEVMLLGDYVAINCDKFKLELYLFLKQLTGS